MSINKLKKYLQIILSIFTGLIFLLLLMIYFISSRPGEKLILNIVNKHLESYPGYTIYLEDLETNLVSRVQIKNATLSYPDGTIFMKLRYGRVDYVPFNIYKNNLSLHSLLLDGLYLSIKRDSTGKILLPESSLERQKRTDSDTDSLQILIKNINIQNSTFSYQDQRIPLSGKFQKIYFRGVHNIDSDYTFQFNSGAGEIVYQDTKFPLAQTSIVGSVTGVYWQISKLYSQCSGLILSGKIFGENSIPTGGSLSLKGPLNGLSDIFMIPSDPVDTTYLPLSGTLNGCIELVNKNNKPYYTTSLNIHKLRLGNTPYINGLIEAVWMDSLVSLSKLNLTLAEGRISGWGSLVIDSLLDHQFKLNINNIQLTHLWRRLFPSTLSPEGIINGQFISSGPIRSLNNVIIESCLNITQFKYQNTDISDIIMNLSIQSGFTSLLINQDENKFKSQWQFDKKRLKGEYSLHLSDMTNPAKLLNITDLQGLIQAKGLISGNLHNPVITSELKGRTINYNNFPIDTLKASVVYHHGNLQIENAEFSGHTINGQYSLNNFPEHEFKGGITYEGKVSGPVSNPDGEINAKFSQPEFGTFTWDEGRLLLKITKGRIYISPLLLRKDKSLFRVNGHYEFNSGSGQLKVSLEEKHSNDISSDLTFNNLQTKHISDSDVSGSIAAELKNDKDNNWYLNAQGNRIQLEKILYIINNDSDWKGLLSFDLSASLGNKNTNGFLTFQVHSLGIDQNVVDSLKGNIVLRNNHLALNPLQLYTSGNKSQAHAFFELTEKQSGNYSLTRESDIRGKAEGSNIDLQFIPPLLGMNIKLKGNSNYKLQWEGKWGKPKLRGYFQVQNGQLRYRPEADMIESLEARLTFSDSLIRINPIKGTIKDIPFYIEGHIHGNLNQKYQANLKMITDTTQFLTVKGEGKNDSLKFKFSIDNMMLSPIEDILSGIHRLDGRLNGEILLSGSEKNPYITGQLSADNLIFQPDILDTPFTDGSMKLTFENNKMYLDSLAFLKEKGSIIIKGETKFFNKEITNIQVGIKAKKLPLYYPEKFKLNVKYLEMQLKKGGDQYITEGNIILGKSSVLLNIKPTTIISFFRKVEHPLTTPPGLFKKTQLNIEIRESNELWIDNNIARLRLHPEISLIGTLAKPNLTGRISVEEGYILYLDRKFKLQKGILDFIDPYQINPVVDVNAQADIKNYQSISRKPYIISLSIEGKLDQAVINLSSNPPLEKPDIITLLTVGATRKDLTGDDNSQKSSISNVLEDRLGQISSSRISGYATRQIGDLIGLTDMSIEGNLFRFGKSWGPKLVASKNITERMEISYSTRVGHSNEQSIRLDYRLLKNLSLQGLTDQEGKSGIDLKFHWKFK